MNASVRGLEVAGLAAVNGVLVRAPAFIENFTLSPMIYGFLPERIFSLGI
jgi:hypothetical protein